jgi:hypothetical protein
VVKPFSVQLSIGTSPETGAHQHLPWKRRQFRWPGLELFAVQGMKMAALTAYACAPSSFLKIVLQAAFFEAASCGAGAGSQIYTGA